MIINDFKLAKTNAKYKFITRGSGMKIRYIGIDIGTSSTVVKLRDYDDSNKLLKYPTQTLKIGGDAIIPSVAFVINNDFKDAANFRFGSDAKSCQLEGSLYTNFKMDLLSEDEEKRNDAKILIAHFMKWIRKHYEEQQIDYFGSCDQEVTIVSYPVRWSKELREFMKSAAYEAGFRNALMGDEKKTAGKDEAEAAIQYLLYSNISILKQYGIGNLENVLKVLLIDMGAGTSDIVFGIFNMAEKNLSVIASYPETVTDVSVGGRDFDEDVFRIVDDYLKSNGILGQGGMYHQQMIVACKEWKEKQLSVNLNRNQTILQMPAFLTPFLINKPIHTVFPKMDRNAFEASFSEGIERFASVVKLAFERAESTGAFNSKEEIDLVVLTGGHSQWYFIPELLTGKCLSPCGRDVSIPTLKNSPDRLLQLSNPSETVALGLVYDNSVANDNAEDNDISLFSEQELMSDMNPYMVEETLDFEGGNIMAENNNIFKDMPILNLLVAGKTGVGKTTLMNNMFGVEVGKVDVGHPVTTEIQRNEVPNYPFVVYDVQGFELTNTQDIIAAIHDKITSNQAIRDEKHMIHAVFYCVEHVGARIEAKEESFIRQLASEYKVPMFLVFTKAFMVNKADPANDPFISRTKSMGLPVVGYYPVVCEKFANTTVEPFGVPELMNDFFDRIGPLIGPYRKQLQLMQIKIKHDKAVNWVWKYAAGNFAIGTFVPAIADIPALSAVETGMAVHLVAILYDGVDMDMKDKIIAVLEMSVTPLLASFAGVIAFSELSKLATYVITVITGGAGTPLTIATQIAGGIVAAGITIAMGRTFITMVEQILEGKIQVENFNATDFKKQAQKEYKDAIEQIKKDKRFDPENFKNKK